MTASFFDMVIGVLVIVFAIIGAKRGLIGEIFRFAAMLIGFFVAFLYYRDLERMISGFAENRQVVAVTAFLLLFIGVFAIITIAGFLLRKAAKIASLGWADRLCGAIFGLLKVGVIAWAACLSIASVPIQKVQDQFGRSVVYKGYKDMPEFFSLDSMEDIRRSILGREVGKPDDTEADKPEDDEIE